MNINIQSVKDSFIPFMTVFYNIQFFRCQYVQIEQFSLIKIHLLITPSFTISVTHDTAGSGLAWNHLQAKMCYINPKRRYTKRLRFVPINPLALSADKEMKMSHHIRTRPGLNRERYITKRNATPAMKIISQ